MVSKVGGNGGVRGSLGGGQGVPSRANVGKPRAPQQNQQLHPATHATAETTSAPIHRSPENGYILFTLELACNLRSRCRK
jgi:hypothetical protein